MAATPVFADVDTGVDDAIALIYLLASPDAQLVGIASTAGNVGVEHVCNNNLSLLDLCRVEGVPVSRGAEHPLNSVAPVDSAVHGSQGLGYAELPPTDMFKVPVPTLESAVAMGAEDRLEDVARFCTARE